MRRIGNNHNGGTTLNINKILLSNRRDPFRPREVEAFMRPIRDFWKNFSPGDCRPPLERLLAIEQEALSAVASATDLQEGNIARTRRKALTLLPTREVRADYVDFLLNLSAEHLIWNRLDAARNILEAILVEDRENWHALKEMAIIHFKKGNLALAARYFDEAGKADRGDYEVEAGVVWEAEVYKASLKAGLAAEVNPGISADELRNMIRPFFDLPAEISRVEKFYYPMLEKLIGSMLGKGVPADTLISVFACEVPGERGLKVLISNLARAEASAPAEKNARKVLAEVKKKKLFPRPRIAELETDLAERLNWFKGDESAAEIIGWIEKGARKEPDIQKIREAFKLADGYTRDVLAEKLEAAAAEKIGSAKDIDGAVLFANALIGIDKELDEKIKMVFAAALENAAIEAAVERRFRHLHQEFCDLAREIANAGPGMKQIAEGAELPGTSGFARGRIVHDFFCVHLAGVGKIKEIYRRISSPYADLLPLKSNWPLMLGANTANRKARMKLFGKAGDNIVARIELAKELVDEGQITKAKKIALEALNREDNPIAQVRAYAILTAALLKEALKARPPLKPSGLEYYSRVEEAFSRIEAAAPELAFISADWANANLNLARIFALGREHHAAAFFGRRALEIKGYNEHAMRIFFLGSFMHGRFVEAALFTVDFLKQGRPEVDQEAGVVIARFLAEALFHAGNHPGALKFISKAITQSAGLIDAHLLKARILAGSAIERTEDRENNIKRAKLSLGAADARIEEKRAMLGATDIQQIEALNEMARGDIALAEGKTEEALAHFWKAAGVPLPDPEFAFVRLDAEWAVIDCTAKLASEKGERQLLELALAGGIKLLKENPDFPPARQAVIGPLISLGRGREALLHIQCLSEHLYGLTADVFANLMVLVSSEKKDLAGEAREIYDRIRKELGPENFVKFFEGASGIVRSLYPDFSFEGMGA